MVYASRAAMMLGVMLLLLLAVTMTLLQQLP
jgi:hypothetical protein